MVDKKNLDGLDKTAILFKALGTRLALQLFKDLTPEDIQAVRRHMNQLGHVPFDLKKEVLEEFYFNFVSEKFKPAEEETKAPFDFLNKLSDEQITYLISTEKPRIMALALAQLTPERQVNILQHLDPTVQPKVLAEIGNLNDIPLEGVTSIASELKEKSAFLPSASEFSRGGSKNLAEILTQLRPRDEKRFLEHLKKEAPEVSTAPQVRKQRVKIDFEVLESEFLNLSTLIGIQLLFKTCVRNLKKRLMDTCKLRMRYLAQNIIIKSNNLIGWSALGRGVANTNCCHVEGIQPVHNGTSDRTLSNNSSCRAF